MPLLFAVALLAHILGLLAFSKPGLAESTHVRQTDGVETTIVFVHGVIGNAQDTWKNGNFYWPSMLAADQDFKDANIFIYEYPTSFWSSMSIDELAENMRLNLDAYSVTQQKE